MWTTIIIFFLGLAPDVLNGKCPKPCTPCKQQQIKMMMSAISRKYPKEFTDVIRQVKSRNWVFIFHRILTLIYNWCNFKCRPQWWINLQDCYPCCEILISLLYMIYCFIDREFIWIWYKYRVYWFSFILVK